MLPTNIIAAIVQITIYAAIIIKISDAAFTEEIDATGAKL